MHNTLYQDLLTRLHVVVEKLKNKVLTLDAENTQYKQTIQDLEQNIHQLQLENIALKAELETSSAPPTTERDAQTNTQHLQNELEDIIADVEVLYQKIQTPNMDTN